MIKHILTATGMWLALAALRVPMILLGFVVVPLALPFRRTVESDRGGLGWAGWHLVRLPWWAYPWDNPRDGALGDTQGRYWLRDAPDWLRGRFTKMWWWLAFRNPCNAWSRFIRPNGVDVRTLVITLFAGDWAVRKGDRTAWQFVVGRGPIFSYYGFYALFPVAFTLHWPALFLRDMTIRWQQRRVEGHINIRLGHKIEPKHQVQDFSADPQKAVKGFTFRVLFDQ